MEFGGVCEDWVGNVYLKIVVRVMYAHEYSDREMDLMCVVG